MIFSILALILSTVIVIQSFPFPITLTDRSALAVNAHTEESHLRKPGHRERMLTFDPDFDDELQGIQLLDSKVATVTSSNFDNFDSEGGLPLTQISTPLTQIVQIEQKHIPNNSEKKTKDWKLPMNSSQHKKFQSTEMNVSDSKTEQISSIMENGKELYSNTNTLKELPLERKNGMSSGRSDNDSRTHSIPLQKNDSNALGKLLMNTKNKSQDCPETQFEQPTSNPHIRLQQGHYPNLHPNPNPYPKLKPNPYPNPNPNPYLDANTHVQNQKKNETSLYPLLSSKEQGKSGILNFPLKGLLDGSALRTVTSRTNNFVKPISAPNQNSVGETNQTEIVSTIVGVLLATVVTFAAAIWLSVDEDHYQTLFRKDPILESRMSSTNPALSSPFRGQGFWGQQNYAYPDWVVRSRSRAPWF